MLTSSPLPPRGVFIPTSMLFHSELPSAVLLTWIQLRALAWKGWSTPAMTLPEFASILGIHPSRLSKHLDHLQGTSALSLRTDGSSRLVISFPEFPLSMPDDHPKPTHLPSAPTPHSTPQTAPAPTSYFPHQILGYLTFEEGQRSPNHPPQSASVPASSDQALIRLNLVPSSCYEEVT